MFDVMEELCCYLYHLLSIISLFHHGHAISIPIIISLNEVFGDIMVLASPPRPPIDPDDVNALKSRVDMRVVTTLRYVAIKI